MAKFFALIIVLGVPIFIFLFGTDTGRGLIPGAQTLENPVMRIGDTPVRVEIADTPEARERGLSGRSELGETAGLLFVFDEPNYYQFWMEDMQFAIDLFWIDENLKVVGILKNLRPETYPRKFEPPVPVPYVLETNARYAETFGLSVGDTVELPRGVTQ